ncbi:MAG: site-specific integrase [Caldilineaceae bacterium]
MSELVSTEIIVTFDVLWEHGKLLSAATDSPEINHFLDFLKLTQSYNTWVNYVFDLKCFFTVTCKLPSAITRADCLAFMQAQDQAGYAEATINRRLAAVSSLFNELTLLDAERFPLNPIYPRPLKYQRYQSKQSLYRRQAQRVPDILSEDELQTFFAALPSWRDRTLVLLMWVSCLRIGEAVAVRFQDIECSRRSIHIPVAKWGNVRTVFMDPTTFAALNRYLDEERKDLFPEVDQLFVAFKGKARGRPLSVNAVQKMLKYHAARCDLPHIHAHLFRHTGITQLIQQGMTEPVVRQFVGHRSPDSLLPYLHLTDDFVENEFENAQSGLDLTGWLGTGGLL